ncbi:MAG: ABC transporter transmembrane domain-containing protein, partial [Betaproteobacteria bacterium]
MTSPSERAKAATPRSLTGLIPFLRPYRGRIAAAVVFLIAAAITTLAFPVALRSLIDGGLGLSGAASLTSGVNSAATNGARVMALREHFLALFGVGVALGVFSALRFYSVTWLGERVTADLRTAVYTHVVRQ